MAVVQNSRAWLAEVLMEYARTVIGLEDFPEITIDEMITNRHHYRVTVAGHRGPIVSKDWAVSVLGGIMDPTSFVRQIYQQYQSDTRSFSACRSDGTPIGDLVSHQGGDPVVMHSWRNNQLRHEEGRQRQRREYERIRDMAARARAERLLREQEVEKERLIQQELERQAKEIPDIVPRRRRVKVV